MGKHQKVKACNLPSGPEKRRSNEKKKTNSKPTDLDRQEIPFKLREIMRSRMEMKNPKKKRKRKPEKQGPQNAELQTDIPVPKFKKHKRESVGAYLSRMNQETQHVMFLSKNQPNREPEMELDIAKDGSLQKETSTKPIQKEESQKRKSFEGRRLDKKLKKKEEKQETHLENEFFKDQVQFGEVAMEPPTFMAKPRKSTVKAKPGEKQLLLKKLFDKEGTSVKPPGMLLARQRMMQEERERVVQAYRELKKRELMKREQEQNAKSKPPRKLDG